MVILAGQVTSTSHTLAFLMALASHLSSFVASHVRRNCFRSRSSVGALQRAYLDVHESIVRDFVLSCSISHSPRCAIMVEEKFAWGQTSKHSWIKPYEGQLKLNLQKLTTAKKYMNEMLSGCALILAACFELPPRLDQRRSHAGGSTHCFLCLTS